MLSVVCWRWAPFKGYRSTYSPETVHTLAAMVRRHYPDPHRFICCTDDPTGIDPSIEIVPIWNDLATVPHPTSPTHPSCYRRLKAFSKEARDWFGKRFVSVDLDCVIMGDLRPLWNRPEDFVGLAGTQPPTRYNGSMFLLTAGARRGVWEDFNPKYSPGLAKAQGFYGSDQAWLSYKLGPDEATWTVKDGIYSYRLHVQPLDGQLPPDARVVVFNGKRDPWSPDAAKLGWVRAHYRQ